MPALPYADAPAFVRDLRRYFQDHLGAKALEFLILTACRTGEVRLAKWNEIDEQARVWTIPEDRTKMRKEHQVPLSGAAWAVLLALKGDRDLEAIRGKYIFTAETTDALPLYEDGMLELAQRIRPGTKDGQVVTPHGFRSTFRDWAGDVSDASEEVAEHALSHAVGGCTRRAYRRMTALEKRRVLMEQWAAFCAGASPLRAAA
jgi:integrase